jgi:geranylgeranyl diphosphate synthase type II
MDLDPYLAERRRLVDKALDERLPPEDNYPTELHRAMRYSLFAGGKRIRPILAMAAAEAVKGRIESVLPLAVALECIHTYSLIHDDLPAMDDDDLRRGKPTLHKVYGEALAVLAGDALLTFAFETLTAPGMQRLHPPERLLPVINELARAAGSEKLVGGQVVDILSEGNDVSVETVKYILRSKTGSLIRASLTCGAGLAGGKAEQIDLLGRYGELLGMVFQIRDDLLDLEGDPAKLGKAVNKDQRRGKATYHKILGKEGTVLLMRDLVKRALETIEPLGPNAGPLIALGKYLSERIH